ncbi:hypothetical protein HPO96_33925 [Kribbella sandramycini]|uniref:Exo-alpha-sialidase n=1 Tax=Kribbella sandramycini TaxID=60450 RepID=A0A7Y4P4J1_9ACTN|nr:hypothetical protein [Kribbella sandramycini]MBB6570397.1 hypothetical protein [Kribbella sandramycini]NOL45259.1 hypothetical protein [Kribbella sandramycini]
MPEIKDAGFSVQEQVRQTDFEQLLQRGLRRRARNQLLLAAGATATAVIAVAALVFAPSMIVDKGADPVAPPKLSDIKPAPGPQVPAEADGELAGLTVVAPDRWAAAWEKCEGENCTYAAKLVRGDVPLVTPALKRPVTVLPFHDPVSSDSRPDLVAVALPEDLPKSADDPAWKDAKLYHLSAGGAAEKPVRYVGETTKIGPSDLVTSELIGGVITLLDVRAGELKQLKLPVGLMGAGSAYRDQTGRVWAAAHRGDGMGLVMWTDDGETWEQHDLARDPVLETNESYLVVSPDGNIAVAFPVGDGSNTAGALLKADVSPDRGRTWRPLHLATWGLVEQHLTWTDRGIMFIGQAEAAKPESVGAYLLTEDGEAERQEGFPKLQTFRAMGDLYYGKTGPRTASVSIDAGKTWVNLPLN